MDLRADHRFSAPPERVAVAMVDPDLVARWTHILDVAAVEVLDHGRTDTTAFVQVRLTYGGSLDPLAARLLGSSNPTWVQTQRIDLVRLTGELTIRPDVLGSVLRCEAAITLHADDGGTLRRLRGTLQVIVPLLGGRAARALAPAIVARLDREAELLEEWLTEG